MSRENTYHFNLILTILNILETRQDLTIDEIFQEICTREHLAPDAYETKNLKERIHKKLHYLNRANRVTLTKQKTRIKTDYYTVSINNLTIQPFNNLQPCSE